MQAHTRPTGVTNAIFLALAFLPLLLLSCAAPAPRPPLPGDAALPDSLAKEPVVVVADSTFWLVEKRGDGNRLVRREVSWYRVNRRNPNLLEEMTFYDDETTQEPQRIFLDAYYPDGRRWSRTDKEMTRRRGQARGLSVDENWFYQTASIPRYSEGLIIRCETVATILRPEFWSHEYLRGDFPCLGRFVSFRAPRGFRLNIGLRNREAQAVAADTLRENDAWEIRLSARGLPKLNPARLPTYPEEWCAALHFSVPPKGDTSYGWKELGDHYLGLIKGSLNVTPGLKQAARGLSESGGADSLAARAYLLLKSRVRYLADPRGMNAVVPRPPEAVLANGYGDCKEMANLMRGLLAEKGVESGLALIRAQGGFQSLEEFPSLGDFNHMILYRRRAPGEPVEYIDATMPPENVASSALPLLGRKTLLLRAGASSLDTVKAGPAFRNRVVTASSLVRLDKGGWELRGTIGLKGKVAVDLGLGLRYRDLNAEEARATVAEFLAGNFGITPREFSWTDASGDSLSIAYTVRAESMILDLGRGGLKLDVPWIFGGPRRDDVREGDRYLAPFEQYDRWTLPPGFRKLQKSELRDAAAQGRWSLAGSEAAREYRSPELRFKSGEAAGWLRFRAAVDAFGLATVWR
jgi:hypothetical protein